jgi:twitching motility two-component system response regulator PilH
LARRILLADDSVTAQNMGRRILSDAGYEVVTVNNGSAALKKIQEQKPDLIVLDVYMPGYGGLEVCQRIKEARETTRIPVLLTVGKLEPFKPDEAKRVRADAYIVKPFEASELLTALTKLEDKIVPQAQTPKSGRFAEALAAIESSDDRFGDRETGWKERLIIPTPSGRLEEPVPGTTKPLAAAAAPVSEIEREQDFRPAESKPSETSVPAGLPADITAEEVAALSAAAAALAARTPGATAETVTEAAGPRPEAIGESSAAEEKLPEATAASDVSVLGTVTTEISEKTAALNPGTDLTLTVATDQSSKEFSRTEAVAISSGHDQKEPRPVNGEANWNKDAEVLAALASLAPVESQAADFAPNVAGIVNQAVEKAQVPEPVATASSKFGPRWIAEAVALTAEDSSLVLEQELEKVLAAVAVLEAAKSEPARAENQMSEASTAAVPEAEPISFAVSSEAAADEPQAPIAEAAYAAAAGSASPVECPRAEPLVSSASASLGITPAYPGQVESQDAELAAAWQHWKEIRETVVASEAGVEPERTATPELKTEPAAPLQPELSKTDPGIAEESEAESTAGEEEEEPAAIASIVDSMLAELRPKLVEEITRKMNSAKKAKIKKHKS